MCYIKEMLIFSWFPWDKQARISPFYMWYWWRWQAGREMKQKVIKFKVTFVPSLLFHVYLNHSTLFFSHSALCALSSTRNKKLGFKTETKMHTEVILVFKETRLWSELWPLQIWRIYVFPTMGIFLIAIQLFRNLKYILMVGVAQLCVLLALQLQLTNEYYSQYYADINPWLAP